MRAADACDAPPATRVRARPRSRGALDPARRVHPSRGQRDGTRERQRANSASAGRARRDRPRRRRLPAVRSAQSPRRCARHAAAARRRRSACRPACAAPSRRRCPRGGDSLRATGAGSERRTRLGGSSSRSPVDGVTAAIASAGIACGGASGASGRRAIPHDRPERRRRPPRRGRRAAGSSSLGVGEPVVEHGAAAREDGRAGGHVGHLTSSDRLGSGRSAMDVAVSRWRAVSERG